VRSVTPKWVKEPKDIRVKSGDNIAIECKADGEPKPTIKWIDTKGLIHRFKNFFYCNYSLDQFIILQEM
jgi:hypothetical protein